jgi:peptide-methionine (S)-S-oxide reductase
MTSRLAASLLLAVPLLAFAADTPFPKPVVDQPLAVTSGEQRAVLAGGCFWGVEAVFEHVRGVVDVTSGYSGGSAKTATYELVSRTVSGHAEAVQVIYDPSKITYGQLLGIFFSVAHDPTQVNGQGPDFGPQYRSVIFYDGEEQQRIARAYVDQLNASRVFPHVLATEVVPLKAFYGAEPYHQDYAARHPADPYIFTYDRPKVERLRARYPEVFVDRSRR